MAPPPDAVPSAAIANRISMLVAAQSSVLATLSPSTTKRRTTTTTATAVNHGKTSAELDDEALFKNSANPNEGVGYVAPRPGSAADTTKQARELRARMLGKRGQEAVAERERMQKLKKKKAMMQGESEDEDAGRSALGKRKRPRREARAQSEDGDREKDEGATDEVGKEEAGNAEVEEKQEDVELQTVVGEQTAQPASTTTMTTATKHKKNKKKKNRSNV